MRESQFIGDVIAAHGGRSRWSGISHVDVGFSAGGFAFASRKLDPLLLRGISGRFDAHTPAAMVDAFGSRHARGEFANGAIRLRGRAGEVLVDRPQARSRFGNLIRQVRWDEGDLFYFASYAMWNYLCFPFFLGTNALLCAHVTPWRTSGWRLDAEFATDFPTHSRHQVFYFDASLRLIRHAYRADVIGPYARALHHCGNYVCTGGIWLACRRLVLPRLWGASSLPFPTLVWIEIANIKYRVVENAPVKTESAACR